MSTPDPWPFVLLSLAAWRLWKLLGDDVILDRPRIWLRNRIKPSARGLYWYEFTTCPYCLGSWVGLGWWGLWLLWPDATLIAAGAFAIFAVVGLLGTVWSSLSD